MPAFVPVARSQGSVVYLAWQLLRRQWRCETTSMCAGVHAIGRVQGEHFADFCYTNTEEPHESDGGWGGHGAGCLARRSPNHRHSDGCPCAAVVGDPVPL